jgi:magnesium-protoporphyrin IX monomethyl ester (oxidative) cyclase
LGLGALFGLTFARLYLLPTQPNAMPEQVCMQPAW